MLNLSQLNVTSLLWVTVYPAVVCWVCPRVLVSVCYYTANNHTLTVNFKDKNIFLCMTTGECFNKIAAIRYTQGTTDSI